METQPASKACKESRCVKISRVFPTDLNNHNTLFGGRLMAYLDDIASISAHRHARAEVVTASTDSVDFLTPIGQEDSVCLTSFVSWTGTSSMEVFVKVVAENLQTGARRVAATAFLTFVALDDESRPITVPAVYPETAEERTLHETAAERAAIRLSHRQASKNLASRLTAAKIWD